MDTAKVFDSVELRYLWGCLRSFGFGPNFIKWVQLLYLAPRGRVVAEPLAISIREDPEIQGLCLGSLTEKNSLYADDTTSLRKTLNTIEHFGQISGLKINWEKSQILPMDSFPSPELQAQLPLQRVNTIKYLGVLVNRTPADYISLNIEPHFDLIKSKTQIWARLPLGVWSRINIVKMILLPKIYSGTHPYTYL